MDNNHKSSNKNQNAVALGSRGGKIGGKARAEKLSPARRSQIASQAARARWKKKDAPSKQGRIISKPNAEATRKRILVAAHKEFTEVGLAGARVDRIAESAGVNKRMLYHYFGNKEELFREMMRRNLLELSEADNIAPQNLGEELVYWRDLIRINPDWMRLSLWEALTCDPENIIGEQERRSFWQKAVEQIKQEQTTGDNVPKFDADFLQLYIFAIAAFPLILPQITKLITGQSPNDPEFLQRQNAFLRCFGEFLKSAIEG